MQPIIFNFGDLKLRDLVKLCFFKLIMTKPNFKKSAMTWFQRCHRIKSLKYVTKVTSPNFSTLSPISIKISGYASGPIKISGYASGAGIKQKKLTVTFLYIL